MEHAHSKRDSLAERRSGYASRQYAESLCEFGDVYELPRSGGWLLGSTIPGTGLLDGRGGYPFFVCHDWRALAADLADLAPRLVSVRVVTDPFATARPGELQAAFPDVCYEYKQHYVSDLRPPLERVVSHHHRRNIRQALAALDVRPANLDATLLRTWQELYDNLIRRHGIEGIACFSPLAFARQAEAPGLVAFVASESDTACGMTLWYVQGDIAYYHLGAYSDRGYQLKASYALFWHALQCFASRGIPFACLGAGAGLKAAASGLTRFKQGWATGTRPAYFGGRILQPEIYAQLAGRAKSRADFFPAYRAA